MDFNQFEPSNEPGKKTLNKNLIVGTVAVLMVLLFGGGMWWLVKYERSGFKVETHKFEYRRHHYEAGTANTDTVKNPKPEFVFSAEMVEKYELGQGIEIPFIVETPTGDKTMNTFVLKTYKEPEEEDNPVRRKSIADAKTELKRLIADWTKYTPVEWNLEVYIDLTGSWGQPLIDQVTSTLATKQLEALGGKSLKERIGLGDTVNFAVYKIRDTDFPDGKTIDSVGNVADFGKIESALNWVWATSPRKGTDSSSVATGLFGAMDEQKGKPNRVILIFSDLIENNESTALMYNRDLKLLESEKYDELETLLLKQRKLAGKGFSDLTGSAVYVYGPKTGSQASVVRMAMKLYQTRMFRKAHAATIQTSY